MAKTCPGCGYSPIGPFTDNCPVCAEPVRNVRSSSSRGGGSGDDSDPGGPPGPPPWLLIGWGGVALVVMILFVGDWPGLLMGGAFCGAAWWAVAKGRTHLVQLLGGTLLVMFVPGVWLATQPKILPGLDQRGTSHERILRELTAIMKGTSPDTLRTRARIKTISRAIYATYAVVAVPAAFLVPPLLNARTRRWLGGPFYLSRRFAVAGLVLWAALVSALGWQAWPTARSWAEPPKNHFDWPADMFQIGGRPQGPVPPPVPADDDDGD